MYLFLPALPGVAASNKGSLLSEVRSQQIGRGQEEDRVSGRSGRTGGGEIPSVRPGRRSTQRDGKGPPHGVRGGVCVCVCVCVLTSIVCVHAAL